MKPYLILSASFLICIAIIWCGGEVIIAHNKNIKTNYLIQDNPSFITQEIPGKSDARYYYSHQDNFEPLNQTEQNKKTNKAYFWLKKEVRLPDSLPSGTYILSFNYLTFVDLTLIDSRGKIITQRKSGSFCKQKDLNPVDGRHYFTLNLDKDNSYTILLRAKHIKGYAPRYDFRLQTQLDYLQQSQQIRMLHVFMEGANIVLLLYIAFAWLVSKYRPYIWIFFFLLFIGCYSFALQDTFIDSIFPNQPQLGWSLVSMFRNLGGISFTLLAVDFLNLRKYHPRFYKLALGLIVLVAAEAVVVFVNNFYFANYKESNWTNISLGTIHALFYAGLFISIWKRIDQMQRFLAYATVFFITGIITLLYCGLILQEQAIQYVSMLTQFFVLSITMLLLIGIRLRLRKSEQEHNKWIEFIVHERTMELSNANRSLQEKQKQLIQKNNYIETLIDEVNHRVKNNLQLLYSLSSMQKTVESQGSTYVHSAQSMQDRIHAMMLVNQLLVYNQNSQLKLDMLVTETVNYLRQMYDPEDQVNIELNIIQDWLISTNTSIPLALIITELLTNSYKYAFPKGAVDLPKISLCMYKSEKKTYMSVADNGIGCEDPACITSFGIKLIQDLTRQIKGKVFIQHTKGFNYLFEFNDRI